MTAPTRRAALTALAGVPALAIPAVAAGSLSTASPAHPDAEIFALIERLRKADKLLDAAFESANEMLWTHVGRADRPRWTDADASVLPDVKPGEMLYPNEIARLRYSPPEAFAERAREIVAAHDDFFGRLKEAKEHPDVVALEDEKDARRDEWGELAEHLVETRAKTVDGMIAKLAMVATDMAYDEDGLSADYDGIAQSAALDAVRLRAAAAKA